MADLTQLTKIDFFVDPTSTSTNQEVLNKALAKLEEMQENADNITDGVYDEFYYGYTYDSRNDLKHYIFPDGVVTEFTLGKNIFMDDEVIPNMDTPADEPTNKAFPDLGYEYLTSTPDDIQELINDTVWDSTLTDGTKYKQVQIQIVSTATAAQIDNKELYVTFYNDIKEFYPVKTSITPTGSIVDLVPIGLNHENLHFTVNTPVGTTVEAIYVKLWIKNNPVGIVTIDNITADNHLDGTEQDSMTTITVSGTATEGVISDGDIVTLEINDNTYTTTVTNGVWSVGVDINDLKDDTVFTATVASKDEDGFSAFSTSDEHTHTVDLRFGEIVVSDIDGDNIVDDSNTGDILVLGTATGGIIADGDVVTVTSAGQDFTSVVELGAFSVAVPTTNLKASTTITVKVESQDFANYTLVTSVSHSHTVKTFNVSRTSSGPAQSLYTNDFYGEAVSANKNGDVLAARPGYNGIGRVEYIKASGGVVSLNPYLGSSGDYFGSSCAISNTVIVAGSPNDDDSGTSSGSACIFDMNGTFVKKIKLPNGYMPSAYYGNSVACNDTHIVIGCKGYNGMGAIFIYDKDGNNEVMIQSSNIASGDSFGYKVDMSDNKIIVAAPYKNSNNGAVYIYDLDGTNEYIVNGTTGKRFGYDVAISNTKYGVSEISASKTHFYDLNTHTLLVSKPGGWAFGMNDSVFACAVGANPGTVTFYNYAGDTLRTINGIQDFEQFGSDIYGSDYKFVIGANRYDVSTKTEAGRISIIG